MPKRNTGKRLEWRESRRSWEIVWFERGRRRRQSCRTDDRRQADRQLAVAVAGEPAGPSDPSARPVAQILAAYMTEHAPSTADPARIGYAVKALLPFWGGCMAGDVRGSTCRAYARQRQAADGTIRRELTCLRAAINHDVAEGRLTRPVPVVLPAKPPPRDRWLTRDEIARLVRAARLGAEARAYLPHFILLAFYTAQRKGAILSLRKAQIDPGTWLIDFRRGRRTAKARPPIPAPRKLRTTLAGLLARTADLGFVISRHGKRVGNIKHSFARAAREAGLAGVTPHTLRHSAATYMVRQGIPIAKVSEWLGHRNTSTTEDVYRHHAPDYLEDAKRAFE